MGLFAQELHMVPCTIKVHGGDITRDKCHMFTYSAQIFQATYASGVFEEKKNLWGTRGESLVLVG